MAGSGWQAIAAEPDVSVVVRLDYRIARCSHAVRFGNLIDLIERQVRNRLIERIAVLLIDGKAVPFDNEVLLIGRADFLSVNLNFKPELGNS